MSEVKPIVLRKPRKEWVGKRFGSVVVISRHGSDKSGSTWLCRCDCGSQIIKNTSNLRAGKSCLKCGHKKTGDSFRTHGMSKTPIYKIWAGMIKRCEDSNDKRYDRYGGRGIKVCERWRNSFGEFYLDMGDRPSPNHSIDRIDNDGNYEPSNCRWATDVEQANNRRSTRLMTFNGITKSMAEWSRATGVAYSQIKMRLMRGCSVEEALSQENRNESV